jgi:hypothetical protein
VLVLVRVETKCPGKGVDDGGAGMELLAALETDVVVDADPGQRG